MQALVAKTASFSTLALAILPILALVLADAQAAPASRFHNQAHAAPAVMQLASR